MDSAGNYLIVWESNGIDGSGFGIYGQRYLAGEVSSGSEFQINTTTANDQRFPDVGMDQTGRSVIVWMDEALDGSGWGIYAQRYEANGTAYGSEFRVNSNTTNHQKFPSLAMNPVGEYVVSWVETAADGSSFQIKARKYDFVSGALHSPLDVDTASSDFIGNPDVAIDTAGNFTIVWQESNIDGSQLAISASMFDNSTTPVVIKDPFQVNTTTSNNQQDPAVATDSDGNFVVVWSSYGQDGDAEGIYGQKFLADGSSEGSEFQVSQTTAGSQVEPFISATIDGSFRASWISFDGNYAMPEVYVRELKADESGTETKISSVQNGNQISLKFAQSQNSKDLVAVWQDGLNASSSSKDGSDFAVVSKSFDVFEADEGLFPVEYLSFSGKARKNGIELSWETAMEQNNMGFEIQRYKQEYQSFVNIDWVASKGDTERGHSYLILDPDVRPGNIYTYRLKQMDQDGAYSYSSQLSVRFRGENERNLLLYPNPLLEDNLHIDLQVKEILAKVRIEIFDRIGKKVYSQEFTKEEALEGLVLPLQSLGEGYYSLLLTGSNFSISQEFVKQ